MTSVRRWLPLAVIMAALLAVGGWGLGSGATTEAATSSLTLTLTGANEVPPVTDTGSATATFQFDSQSSVLSYTLTIHNVAPTDVTGAHIHLGGVGVNGPILHPLTVSKTSSTTTGSVTLNPSEVGYLKQGSLYVNVHSVEHPSGFARAQLVLGAESQIQSNYDDIVAAWNSQNVEGFIAHFTDAGLLSTFGFASRDEARQQLPDFMSGGPISITVKDITVNGNTATSHASIDTGDGAAQNVTHTWVYQNGQWMIDSETQEIVPIPAGVKTVDLKLQEYAFVFDKSAIPADGNFAFAVTNAGTMSHEADLAMIPADMTTTDLVNYLQQSGPSAPPPPGVTDIGSVGPIGPGAQANLVFNQPLAPGHYALLCFVTGSDGIPHIMKGMIADFTVGTASGGGSSTGTSTGSSATGTGTGSITPPNTGDAGLKPDSVATSEMLLVGALLVVFTGASAFALSRRSNR